MILFYRYQNLINERYVYKNNYLLTYDFHLFSKNVIFYRHDLYLLDFDIVDMVSFDTKYFFHWINN